MATVGYVNVPAGSEDAFNAVLVSQDRYASSRITRKTALMSNGKKLTLKQRSYLPLVRDLWSGLSAAEKLVWKDAGAIRNRTAYRLFTQDTCIRIKNGLPGVVVPSLLHQAWVGMLSVQSPATEIKIIQQHPQSYYVKHKITGKQAMYNTVLVTENFALPLVLSLNYKSNLVSQGAGSFAKFFARLYYSYQGVNEETDVAINFDLVSDWKTASITSPYPRGQFLKYELYFHLYNMRGELYFDNVSALHSGQNWVRDPYCEYIEQSFTRMFQQVPKHWASLVKPTGSEYYSTYPDV